MNLNLSELFSSKILYHSLSSFDTLSSVQESELWPSNQKNVRKILENKDVTTRRVAMIIKGAQKMVTDEDFESEDNEKVN